MIKRFGYLITFLVLIICFTQFLPAFAATIVIEADKQTFHVKNNTANFSGNVRLNYGNIKIKSVKATLNSDVKGNPQQAVFTQNVFATKDDKTSQDHLNADSLTLMVATNQMIAQGNTYSHLKKNTPGAITVKAQKQEFNNVTNDMKASGDVVITYKGMTIYGADASLTTTPAGKPDKVVISGGTKVVRGVTTINAGSITLDLTTHNLMAAGEVNTVTVLDDKSGSVSMNSDYQQFDKTSNTIIGSGHVKVVYQDYIATGPKATIFTNETSLDKIVFSGGSQIKDSMRMVSANVITVSLNPKNFTAEGNVKTQLIKQDIPGSDPSGPATNKTNSKPQDTEVPDVVNEASAAPPSHHIFGDL